MNHLLLRRVIYTGFLQVLESLGKFWDMKTVRAALEIRGILSNSGNRPGKVMGGFY